MKTMTFQEEVNYALEQLNKVEEVPGLYNGEFYSINMLPAVDVIMKYGKNVSTKDVFDEDGYHQHVEYIVLFAGVEIMLFAKYAKEPHRANKNKEEIVQLLESVIV